ncbi:aldehyde dehydrogenase family protein [Calothrix sp. UHCC 0171]|uniref:aldehyde dehydrogenase family protein n=1 Tax=Calothrix sp. UHCC 0171 TaxID=3110245 RepID=UPI002B21F723|nr:aldehyde dehydrogenase family protein [Calothrix sp. UHCC 0171]MEA5569909.1 aldehyde dehydrogenase family protein [Calothrix sp. UHCC 0171]
MSKSIDIRNPRSGKYDYVVIPPPQKLLLQQFQRLRRAQLRWLALGLEGRIEALQSWKQSIVKAREKLTEALIVDTGRLAMSIFEVDSFISNIDRWCILAPRLLRENEFDTPISQIKFQQTAVPYPLVGVITPWDFPLLQVAIDTLPALISGCAVVVKPSEITPRFIAPLMTTFANIPQLKDVLAFVEGDADTEVTVVESVDFICFTGNLETGRAVAEIAAQQFIPACVELGGKNPAIVLESANIDLATSAILWGAVVNSGQSAHAIERIYVAESIFEDFYHQLVAKAHRLQIAHPTLESGELGPIISVPQAAIIREQLQQAKENGAVVHCGGEVENINGGLWCRPTVLTAVDNSMSIMTERTLAPIMPVMAVTNSEEAVNLANDSIYGLSAAIFTESEAEAEAVAEKVQAGNISINDASLAILQIAASQGTITLPEGEQNAFKFSGIGNSRTGITALTRFLRKKTLYKKNKPIPDSWWFNS